MISFHFYGRVPGMERPLKPLRKLDRILCTECVGRLGGGGFDPIFGFLKEQQVGAYGWGFVAGRTQTIYPPDSWHKPYTAEPPVWCCDLLRSDGTPHIPAETDYIQSVKIVPGFPRNRNPIVRPRRIKPYRRRRLQDFTVDRTILERIAAGDPQAVDECTEQFGGLVWSLARRFSPVYADAEDAVQEIFFEVWRSASRFDPRIASEAAFIATIAKRRLIDRRRRRSRTVDAGPLEERTTLVAAEEADPVELQDEADRVRAVMGRLRDEERRVLELSLVEGLTHSQISKATSLPLGTVKTHARRGLNRLREMLGAEHVSSTLDQEP